MQFTRIKFSIILAFTALLAGTAAQAAETLVVSGRHLDVFVDLDHCALAGSVLCGGTGSLVPAADGNDSIVQVIVHVKGPLGNPIGGLLETDFSLTAISSPGGVSPWIVDSLTCLACFSAYPTGIYRMAVRPVFGDWAEGTYFALLEVNVPSGAVRQTVIPFDIPL